jgi:hypothetical protein
MGARVLVLNVLSRIAGLAMKCLQSMAAPSGPSLPLGAHFVGSESRGGTFACARENQGSFSEAPDDDPSPKKDEPAPGGTP